jgi:hypothetical protein
MSTLRKILQIIILFGIWETASANIILFEKDTIKKDSVTVRNYSLDQPVWQQVAYLETRNQFIPNIATQIDTSYLLKKGRKNDIQNSDLIIKEDVGLEEWKVEFFYKDILAEKEPTRLKYTK